MKGAQKNGPKSKNAAEDLMKNGRERIKSTNDDESTKGQPENSEGHPPLSNPENKYLQEAIKYLTKHGYWPNEQSKENGTEVGWGSEEEAGLSDNECSNNKIKCPL